MSPSKRMLVLALAGLVGSNVYAAIDLGCEVCQITAWHLHKLMEEELPRSGKGRGARDVLASELVDAQRACDWHSWKDYADRIDDAEIYQLTKMCRDLVGDEEMQERFEEGLGKKQSSSQLAESVCASQCKSAGFWEKGKDILSREGKKTRALKQSKEWLEENSKKEGVTVLPSGLQYKVLQKGTGTRSPKINERCSVHYEGTLIDGTKFDSSYDRNEPTVFAPNQVIAGWTEALQMMVEGDSWEIYVPPDIGYGEEGSPPKIPGNSALVFKMELLKILEAEKSGNDDAGFDLQFGNEEGKDNGEAPMEDQVPEVLDLDGDGSSETPQDDGEASKTEL